jgi:hypothetical protein
MIEAEPATKMLHGFQTKKKENAQNIHQFN